MSNQSVDIAIIGGGLIGAALMIGLKNSGYSSLLVDAKPLSQKNAPDFNSRTLALSPASQRILNHLGVWSRLINQVTPIDSIDVSEQFRFGRTRLKGNHSEPLGFVIEMQELGNALYESLDKQSILAPATVTHFDSETHQLTITTTNGIQTISPKIVVAADGSDSLLRSFTNLPVKVKTYPHCALVANIGLSRSHHCYAYERFTPYGPLAILPLSAQRASLVWTLPVEKAKAYQAMEEAEFLKCLQQTFGYKLGRFLKVGQRQVIPLRQTIMPDSVKWPMVFVGNAAHTLHPVAGQGFNLGLRDIGCLIQCIAEKGLTPSMFESYEAMRRYDQKAIALLTDGLVELFTFQRPGFSHLRALGLMTMDQFNPLKKVLLHHTRGFAGVVPQMACENQNGNL